MRRPLDDLKDNLLQIKTLHQPTIKWSVILLTLIVFPQLSSEGFKITELKNCWGRITVQLLPNCLSEEEASSCGTYMGVFHKAAVQENPIVAHPQKPLLHSNSTPYLRA